MLSLYQNMKYKKCVGLFSAVMVVALIVCCNLQNINTITESSSHQRNRYLQRKETNTRTMTKHEGSNDDVSADTLFITFSILNTIFFVLPTTVRYAFQKRRCLQNPTNVNPNGCICSFPQLQFAISNSNNRNETSVLIICPGTTIAMEQPLNITTKRFLLTCGTSRFINTQPCQFQRSTTTTTTTTNETWINYLIGAPTNVTIEDVTFYNGYSHNSNSASGSDMSGNGGAIYMTGGYLTLQNVIFESNYATNRGGAIYINTNVGHSQSSGPPPDAIIKIRSRTTFRNNVAADDAIDGGQDIYIVPAAVTKPPLLFFNITNGIINVECVPSTLLSRPKFCNYNNDASSNRRSIVIENITTDTEQRKYTNCMDMNLIDTRC